MPTAIPVTPTNMNYASVVFLFFASVIFIWYLISGRKNFNGPPVVSAEEAEHQGQVLGGEMGRAMTPPGSSEVGSFGKKTAER